jgi:hypothetical protein
MKMNVEGKRGRERPKKRWLDSIENDMNAVGACGDVENRDE